MNRRSPRYAAWPTCRDDEHWAAAAADPLLRKLTTLHLLALGRVDAKPEDMRPTTDAGSTALAKLHLQEAEGAEYLGWMAYDMRRVCPGRTLARPRPADDPPARWLRARLLRRAGKLDRGRTEMMQAWNAIRDTGATRSWRHPAELPDNDEGPGRDTVNFSAPMGKATS